MATVQKLPFPSIYLSSLAGQKTSSDVCPLAAAEHPEVSAYEHTGGVSISLI
jgi:hypothetical protein